LEIKRYDIFFADLNPSRGSEVNRIRPVVDISHDEMNKYLNTKVICPLTSSLHPDWRSRIQISCVGKDAEIAVDQIRTVSKSRLKNKVDSLPKNTAAQLRKLITDMYGE